MSNNKKLYIHSDLEAHFGGSVLADLIGESVRVESPSEATVWIYSFSSDFKSELSKLESRESIQVVLIDTSSEKLDFARLHNKYMPLLDDPNIVSILPLEQLESSYMQKLFQASIIEGEGLPISHIHEGMKIKSVRISDFLNLGHFTDIITTDAYEMNISSNRVRRYFTDVFMGLAQLSRQKMVYFPFDLEYGLSNGILYSQLTVSVDKFERELLSKEIHENGFSYEHPILRNLSLVDGLEVHYIKKFNKLILTAVWVGAGQISPYLAIGEFDFYSSMKSTNEAKDRELKFERSPVEAPVLMKTLETEDGPLEVQAQDVETEPQRIIAEDPELSQLVRVKRFVEFSEDLIEDPESFEKEDLEQIIAGLPDQTLPDKLTESDKEAIVDFIKNPKKKEELEEQFEKIVSSVDEDEFTKKVESSLDDISFDELAQIVSGSAEDESDIEKVKGHKEDLSEEAQRVKGSAENETSKKIVTGDNQELTPEVWAFKKEELAENLKQKIETFSREYIDNENLSFAEKQENKAKLKKIVEEEAFDYLVSNVGFKEKDAEGVAAHIVDEAILNMTASTDSTTDEKTVEKDKVNQEDKAEIFSLRREVEKLSNSNNDLTKRNEKMMKVIQSMKSQIQMMYDVEMEMKDFEDEDENVDGEVDYEKYSKYLKQEVAKAKGEVQRLNSTLEKLREGNENIIKARDKQIEQLNRRLSEVNNEENLDPNKESSKQLVTRLEKENELLKGQLAQTSERLTQVSENFEKRFAQAGEKARSEIASYREKFAEQNKTLKELLSERNALERELTIKGDQLKEALAKAEGQKDEVVAADGANANQSQENEAKIAELEKIIRGQESKFKASQLKFKQYEQKIKFLNSQLELAQRSGASAGSGAAKSPDQKAEISQLKHKLNQATTSSKRLEKALKKATDDLSERKKETIRLTQLNNTLQTMLEELQRKEKNKAA